MTYLDRHFSIAPMMDWTDRHDRYFLRLITRHAWLYTEMVTTGALIHGDRERFLRYDPAEHPVALQLGGSEPRDMALCARMAEDAGYDEVNINVGCPSERVQRGAFGACLMAEPALIAECVDAMRNAVHIPVTVKTRIGLDKEESREPLWYFVETVAAAGCTTFIVHARNAWLKGLSPKENREVPPLRYDIVHDLKQAFPALEILINGGIKTLEAAGEHLNHVDGVMLGREAYHNPYLLARVDALFYGDDHPVPTREAVLEAFLPYVQRELDAGVYLSHMSRHILGLFLGEPGARAWRRHLSEHAPRPGATITILREALALVQAKRGGWAHVS